jgi:hypothetical protein
VGCRSSKNQEIESNKIIIKDSSKMETGIAKTLLLGKARASLILPFVADALSMPAHWIYKQPEIK